MDDPSEPSPRREITPEIRNRFLAGGAAVTLSTAAIVAVIVATTMQRMPVYGWWPVAIGSLVIVGALVFSYQYFRRRLFYAKYGVESVAVVVHVHEGGRNHPRVVTFEYEYGGAMLRSKRGDRYFKVGKTLPILVNPRDPSCWIARTEILHEPPAKS